MLAYKVVEKNELRRYMGSKHARVPRGSVVKLIAVVNGKMGIFEWDGERFNCPVRLLHRIQTKERFEKELMRVHGKAIEEFTETRLRVEFKRADQILLDNFREWLRERYAETTVENYVRYLKAVFQRVGITDDEEKVRNAFWSSSCSARKSYMRAFHRFQDFLDSRSSFTEEKRREVIL